MVRGLGDSGPHDRNHTLLQQSVQWMMCEGGAPAHRDLGARLKGQEATHVQCHTCVSR